MCVCGLEDPVTALPTRLSMKTKSLASFPGILRLHSDCLQYANMRCLCCRSRGKKLQAFSLCLLDTASNHEGGGRSENEAIDNDTTYIQWQVDL